MIKKKNLSLAYFSSKILSLAEIVNHPQSLFEMPSAPCAFWSVFYFYFLISVEQRVLCCATAPAAAQLLWV